MPRAPCSPADSHRTQGCYDYRGSLCLESLLSCLLVRQPEKKLLSDSIINSKLNFAGKHHAVFYRYHFVLSYRLDLFRVLSKCRALKNILTLTGHTGTLAWPCLYFSQRLWVWACFYTELAFCTPSLGNIYSILDLCAFLVRACCCYYS